jgi:hypothetical protein
MNRTDYYRAGLPVLLGAFLGMSFLSLLYVVNVEMEPVEATPPKPIVEVVGTYKECEIIQYTNKNLARYSYMLYCGNQK